MAPLTSDAFVFFGATGDLAHKKIFPALQSMVKHGTLNVPVIGVAKSGWTVEQLRERARDSLTKFGGGVDEAAFAKLCELMSYIDGDYEDDKTYATPSRQAWRCAIAYALPGDSAQHVSRRGAGAGEVPDARRTRGSSWRSLSAATWSRPAS